MDDGLAGEAIQQIQLHLPAQPLFPSLAGVILPYRAGHHVLSAESRHDVDEDIRHRAQVVDGPICRTAQAEGVGEVVPPPPGCLKWSQTRCPAGPAPPSEPPGESAGNHGRRLKHRHIEVLLRPADGADGCKIGPAVLQEKLGQDESAENGGKRGVLLRQPQQLLR